MRSVDVWVQFDGSGEVALKYWNDVQSGVSENELIGRSDANSVIFKLGNLDPGTSYSAVVVQDGVSVSDTIELKLSLIHI